MPWIMTEKSAIFHTVLSAYLSIIAGLIEAGLSLYSGHAEISMSLYGIALMAIVDITGSVLVLKMWQCGSISDERLISERRQEMYYSIVIGTLMVVLGFFLIVDRFLHESHVSFLKFLLFVWISLKNFTSKESPDDQSWIGTVVTIFGSICGLSLAAYKYAVGVALDSPVVIAGDRFFLISKCNWLWFLFHKDSVSSLCSGLTSLTALVVVLIDDRLWWSDSSAGFTAALYTLYSGCSTVLNARVDTCTTHMIWWL